MAVFIFTEVAFFSLHFLPSLPGLHYFLSPHFSTPIQHYPGDLADTSSRYPDDLFYLLGKNSPTFSASTLW